MSTLSKHFQIGLEILETLRITVLDFLADISNKSIVADVGVGGDPQIPKHV